LHASDDILVLVEANFHSSHADCLWIHLWRHDQSERVEQNSVFHRNAYIVRFCFMFVDETIRSFVSPLVCSLCHRRVIDISTRGTLFP
jgi:hypothetical protein